MYFVIYRLPYSRFICPYNCIRVDKEAFGYPIIVRFDIKPVRLKFIVGIIIIGTLVSGILVMCRVVKELCQV